MNAISKVLASVVIGASLMSSAIAAPQIQATAADPTTKYLGGVTIQNATYDSYTVYAIYPVSGASGSLYLGPIGTPGINFATSSYDNTVCLLAVRRSDHYIAFNECLGSGDTVTLHYFMKNGLKKNMPEGQVTH